MSDDDNGYDAPCMDDQDRAWVASFGRRIPEDAFVEGFVTVIAYTTPEGDSEWCFYNALPWRTSGTVGLLEMAKQQVVLQSIPAIARLQREEGDG
jgi:hypothetical protein